MATWLPAIEIHDWDGQFEIEAPSEAFVELAEVVSSEAIWSEITPEDVSVLVVRATDGPVVIGQQGQRVDFTGGREALDNLAHEFRSVAAGPQGQGDGRYHIHVEHFPGHLWLAAGSVPMVVTLAV